MAKHMNNQFPVRFMDPQENVNTATLRGIYSCSINKWPCETCCLYPLLLYGYFSDELSMNAFFLTTEIK